MWYMLPHNAVGELGNVMNVSLEMCIVFIIS